MGMSDAMPSLDITVVVLVGGQGSRLRSVVSDRPKVLAQVRGRPFLSYIFDQIIKAGLRHVVLCSGYMAESISAEYGQSYGNLTISYSVEDEPLSTAGALRLALPLIETESVLVTNGDSLFDTILLPFMEWFSSREIEAALLLAKMPDRERFGSVTIDGQGRVVQFHEKGCDVGTGWINAGVYLMRTSIVALIPPGRKISLEREFFPDLVKQARLHAFPAHGRFIDIGTPESYCAAAEFFSHADSGSSCT